MHAKELLNIVESDDIRLDVSGIANLMTVFGRRGLRNPTSKLRILLENDANIRQAQDVNQMISAYYYAGSF